jgi:transcriptional regulator with XRE-family HTH domain
MEERGLNRHSLAEQSGIPYTTIDGWYKKGSEGIKLSTLKSLSAFFCVPLDCWSGVDREKENPSRSPDGEGEELRGLADQLREMLVRIGWIDPGGKLTPRQRELLDINIQLLKAQFKGKDK